MESTEDYTIVLYQVTIEPRDREDDYGRYPTRECVGWGKTLSDAITMAVEQMRANEEYRNRSRVKRAVSAARASLEDLEKFL